MTVAPRVPGLSDDEQATLSMLVEQLARKSRRNAIRTQYYEMKRAIKRVGTIVPPQYYNLGLTLGWTGKAVDALVRRCRLESFKWPDGDLDGIGYNEFVDENRLFAEITGAEVHSTVHGVSFLINTTGDEADGEPRGLLHVKDALSATGQWNSRRRALDALLSVTARGDDGSLEGFVLYLDGLTIRAEKSGGRWDVDRHEHVWGVPVEPMIYKPWTRPFGHSRITRAMMSAQDMATRALIRLEGHMDIYSYPEFWMLGADSSVFKNADGSMKSAWQVQMGRIKGLPDSDETTDPALARADVKQFPAASPEPHLAALNTFAKLMARESSLPDSDFALTDMANPTSAEAYLESRESLIAEAEGATDDWELPLRRALVRGLAMRAGLDEVPVEWRTITPRWRPPRYESRAAQADAGMKQLTAMPWLGDTDVGLELLGLSPDQIARAKAERRTQAGRASIEALLAGPSVAQSEGEDADAIAKKANALGQLIRAGVSPESAAAHLGLSGLEFTGATPVSLRQPESAADRLEDR